MIVVSLTYKVATEVLDQHLDAHVAWLKAGYAAGQLLASGRKVPRTGGLLLVRGGLAEVEAWAATDPFAINDLADYAFSEVNVTMTAEGLDGLKTS